MAKPGSKAAKKPDPHRADEWPVSKFPYLVSKPNEETRKYLGSYAKAIEHMSRDVKAFRKQFELISQETVTLCDRILGQIRHLPVDGGRIDSVIDPVSQVRYRAELIRRKEVL